MRYVWSLALGLLAAVVIMIAGGQGRVNADTARAEIDAFNQKYIAAHLKMDNAMISSFWMEDGVSLLPGTPPLVGKKAIDKFVEEAVARIAGYHMEKMEIDFREIQLMGDWAYEWGLEHQALQSSDGKLIEGRGNILLILHKNPQGEWKIKQEMWNPAPKTAEETKTQ